MEITLPHEQLVKALELTNRIAAKHTTLPVLQCVRISAEKETIVLEATNLEINISVPLEGQVTEEGVVAVPAQIFLQSIQLLQQNEVTLRLEDAVLQIETTKSNTSINTFAVDEFPTIKVISGEELTVSANSFAHGIKSVAFAASQTSIKPELGSISCSTKKRAYLNLCCY